MKLAIFAMTADGARTASRLRRACPQADLFVRAPFAGAVEAAISFSGDLEGLLGRLWANYRGFVFLMDAARVVQLLVPHLRAGETGRTVVVMDEAGDFAVSLLGGAPAGTDELARQLATVTGGQAVITTGAPGNELPAWDEVACQAGLQVEPEANLPTLNALLQRGETIALVDRCRRIAERFRGVPGVVVTTSFYEALRSGAAGLVFVTHRHIPQAAAQENLLLLRPKDLVLGIDCTGGTSAEEIEAVVGSEMESAFLALQSVACIATTAEKHDEEGLLVFARRHRLPVEYHALAVPGSPSAPALAVLETHGGCEPAAVLSAGGGPLLVRRKQRGRAAVAVAEKVGETDGK